MSKVKDLKLAGQGKKSVEWAESQMPVLMRLRREYADKKPLNGLRIAGAIHVTKETGCLVRTLKALGAEVAWCGCNPLSTQDDAAAALASEGINIFAWRGLSDKDYYWCIDQVIETIKPNITMDDGADLVFRLHEKYPDLINNVILGTEETTTGVKRLKNMAKDGKLLYPIIAINNAETKWDFDNIYGTAQGTIDAIMRSTSTMITGKTVVVAGYGHCGKGVAERARGMGANVTVTEVEPIKALKAVMDGFKVMPISDAVKIGDIIITATGCKDVINKAHFPDIKDSAILLNVGHFNIEIRTDQLEEYAVSKREIRKNVEEFILPNKKKVYLLGQGRLANLACAEGHPSAVMDLSFSNQVLALLKYKDEKLGNGVYDISREQDEKIARLKLESMGIRIDALTAEQKKYLESWSEGT